MQTSGENKENQSDNKPQQEKPKTKLGQNTQNNQEANKEKPAEKPIESDKPKTEQKSEEVQKPQESSKPKEEQKTQAEDKNAKKEEAKTSENKQKSENTNGVSKEEQIRIQRKKVIDEINQYLSEQNSDLGIPLLSNENEASTNSQESTASSSSSVPSTANTNKQVEELKESEKAEVNAEKEEQKKKMNILPSLMHAGVFIPPSITRQAISDALESEGIDPNGELEDPNYVQQDSMASTSLNLLILVVMMGAVYHFLRKILKDQDNEDDIQKYENGIDSLMGQRGNPAGATNNSGGSGSGFGGPSNESFPLAGIKEYWDGVYRNSQNVAKNMADNVLNQYESRYNKKTDDPVQQLARQSSEMPIMGAVQQDDQNDTTQTLYDGPSLVEASQSMPAHGGISSDIKIVDEPEDNQIREKLRQKASLNKNKKIGEGSDDEFDMA